MATIKTNAGVLSFPHLFDPSPRFQGGEPVYSATLLFDEADQKTAEFKALKAEVDRLREEISKEKKVPLSKVDTPLHDAGDKAGKYAGYLPGGIYIKAWSKNPVEVVGPSREKIYDKNDVFAGQRARMVIYPFKYAVSGNAGVSFLLNAVQILKLDCERIDGRVSAAQAFDDGVGEYDAVF